MNEKSRIISDIFDEFIKIHHVKNYDQFNTSYIFEHKLWKWNSKISLRSYLIESGINPDCVFSSKRGLYKTTKPFLNKIINELIIILGRENLNDSNMNTSKEITPPKSLQSKGEFRKTDKINFPLKKIKLKSIQKTLRTKFDCSWRNILTITGNEEIERKRSKNTIQEVLSNYLDYKKTNQIDNITEIVYDKIRKTNKRLEKQIWRISDELEFSINKYSNFFIGLFSLEYFNKNQELPSKEVLLKNKVIQQFKEYLMNQEQVRWEKYPEILQDIILGMYVKGSSIYGDDNKTSVEKRVTDKVRHWKGEKSINIYKNSGILINELQNIKSILDTKYDRKQIYNKFRELLNLTITTGINHLSREYIEENEKEFMNSCFKVERIKTNNWGKVLELYGINGDLFLPDRLDVSKRGNKFEKLINKLFTKYLNLKNNRSQLGDKLDFWYQKKQGNMIPDFTFLDKIIDTKFSIGYSNDGFHHDQIKNQLEKYHKTKKDIIILTFNKKNDVVNFKNRQTIIINLKSLKKFILNDFGIVIEDFDIKYIFDEINNIKFNRRYLGKISPV